MYGILYHVTEVTANQMDGTAHKLPIMRCAWIVLATFLWHYHRIVTQRFLFAYHEISHLPLVFSQYTHSPWSPTTSKVLFCLIFSIYHPMYSTKKDLDKMLSFWKRSNLPLFWSTIRTSLPLVWNELWRRFRNTRPHVRLISLVLPL